MVVGYVVMPEHFHLLLSEPEKGDPSIVVRSNLLVGRGDDDHEWQKRFYDFNVYRERKRVEKLRYIHRSPVKRGLVESPEQWAWSSFRSYAFGEKGRVWVNFQEWTAKIKMTKREESGETSAAS